eukprot:6209039-Pleurochrysis_carterae.AAC.1
MKNDVPITAARECCNDRVLRFGANAASPGERSGVGCPVRAAAPPPVPTPPPCLCRRAAESSRVG